MMLLKTRKLIISFKFETKVTRNEKRAIMNEKIKIENKKK